MGRRGRCTAYRAAHTDGMTFALGGFFFLHIKAKWNAKKKK
jgi:hypothetical protein